MKTHSVATAQLCISLMFTLQDLSSSLKAVTRKSFLNIEIVTLGYTSREGIGALPFTAPVMDIVVSQLNLLYQTSFNISQTYRFAENSTCQDLKETSEVYFSEWYYRPTGSFDLRAYIAPTCYDSLGLYHLASAWNILMISTVIGPETDVIRQNKNWVYTGSTSYSDYSTIYINFLLRYNWTSHIHLTIDLDSPSGFVIFGKAVHAALVVRFAEMQITLKFTESRSEHFDIPALLKHISSSSRIAGLFVSAVVLRKIMVRHKTSSIFTTLRKIR
ncbi:hypothetical protein RvY_06316-1 [Ramazzottius varieornatus]|uniref:Uncharacterized protein n=1 Tax=Ramazzottius varieornatus TaxID=947166 RepID=A0A1D1V7T9_RAMVA|nr:hypothetical protein RvY_06316-1 [Ramazzottius varieornatus]